MLGAWCVYFLVCIWFVYVCDMCMQCMCVDVWCVCGVCAMQMPVVGMACVAFLCGKVFLYVFELCVVYVICDM